VNDICRNECEGFCPIFFLTRKYLFCFRNELPEILEEEGRGRFVVLDGERQLGPGVPQDVDGLLVRCGRQVGVVDYTEKNFCLYKRT
jgi:hypothetical protein